MTTTGSSSPVTAEACQSTFEQAVALSLHMWPALSLAVQNNWGGPDSADKRDWFAGAIVELFPTYAKFDVAKGQAVPASASASASANADAEVGIEEPDTAYVETVLLQVMVDEFEVNVDDETAFDVADRIVKLRADIAKGNFAAVEDLRRKWEGRKGAKVDGLYKKVDGGDQDTDWEDDSEGDDDDGEEEDVDMDDAPQLVAVPKEKPQPEVDEDGFTMVTKKKR